jgi:hypothetical protein
VRYGFELDDVNPNRPSPEARRGSHPTLPRRVELRAIVLVLALVPVPVLKFVLVLVLVLVLSAAVLVLVLVLESVSRNRTISRDGLASGCGSRDYICSNRVLAHCG